MSTDKTTVPGHVADAIFKAGYEAGKADSIDRCMIERRALDKAHNAAIGLCVVAIRALDVRHALQKWISANDRQNHRSRGHLT